MHIPSLADPLSSATPASLTIPLSLGGNRPLSHIHYHLQIPSPSLSSLALSPPHHKILSHLFLSQNHKNTLSTMYTAPSKDSLLMNDSFMIRKPYKFNDLMLSWKC
ncbi:hypothetical protein AMTRI_Chr11g153720 [Amborella trichopoda]